MIETILIILLLVGLLINNTRRPKNFPPGPIPLPIVGSFHLLDHEYPQKSLDAFHKKYGPYSGVLMGNFQVVIVNGWEAINEVLGHDDILGRPDVCLIRDRYDGHNYGILFTDGHNWRTQRRFTLHHFRNLGFGKKSHEAVIQEESDYLMEIIKNFDGKPFQFEHYVITPILNTLWHVIGENRFRHSTQEMVNVTNSIKDTLQNIKFFGSIAVGFPFLRYLFPTRTGYKYIKRSSKCLQEFLQKSIREHASSRIKDHPRDFIDSYLDELEKPDVDSSFSEGQLAGLCIDILFAGDTSVSVLSFAILYLCLRKDIQENIYKEIQEHVGGSRLPSTNDKGSLVWTEAVLMEVLRMRPPAPNTIPHRAEKDLVCGGYDIPKDTIVILNLLSIFMDPNYFEDPESFRPERYITAEGKLKKEERLIPFGKGKRSCLGESIARTSTFIILSSLIQRFSFEFDPSLPVPGTEGVPGFTLGPPFFKVIATPRT